MPDSPRATLAATVELALRPRKQRTDQGLDAGADPKVIGRA
jgi:hypothetical protein